MPAPCPETPRELSVGNRGGENTAGFPGRVSTACPSGPAGRSCRVSHCPPPGPRCCSCIIPRDLGAVAPSRLCPITLTPSSLVPPTVFLTAPPPPSWASQVALVIKNPPASAGDGRHRFHPWGRKIPWRREWQPAPVSLPGESCGQRHPAGCSPWGRKESDSTEAT